jgi:hypothetical protein
MELGTRRARLWLRRNVQLINYVDHLWLLWHRLWQGSEPLRWFCQLLSDNFIKLIFLSPRTFSTIKRIIKAKKATDARNVLDKQLIGERKPAVEVNQLFWSSIVCENREINLASSKVLA